MTTLLLETNNNQSIALSLRALRLKATNCRGGTGVSLSRLPATLHSRPNRSSPVDWALHTAPRRCTLSSRGQGKGSNPRQFFLHHSPFLNPSPLIFPPLLRPLCLSPCVLFSHHCCVVLPPLLVFLPPPLFCLSSPHCPPSPPLPSPQLSFPSLALVRFSRSLGSVAPSLHTR